MNDIISLYGTASENSKNNFERSLSSSLKVKEKINEVTYDDMWLVKMEDTLKYLDNILRNPNRFIINDEEIVKIELARRITVDSIKHLSRNTNLIQDIDKKTGEVKPSKILNINKEETFNTYENRFIYTLINNMKLYIERKKKDEVVSNSFSANREFNYDGKSKLKGQDMEISLRLISKKNNGKKSDNNELALRIEKVEQGIKDLCASDVYKSIAKLHVAPVTSPIKKTNLILKNVNFQYALDLWNYIQSNMDCSVKKNNSNKNYEDNGKLKLMMDESFLLNCLIMNTLNNDEVSSEEKENLQKRVAKQSVNSLMNINDLSLEDLIRLVGDEYVKVKYKRVADTSEIERIYKKAINDYMNKIKGLKVKRDENIK